MYGQRRSVLVSGNACLATNVRCSDDGADRPAAHPTVGCMGAGKSLNLARLGMAVTLHTALGDDQPGRRVRERLARDGLRLIIDTDPAGTNTLPEKDAAGEDISSPPPATRRPPRKTGGPLAARARTRASKRRIAVALTRPCTTRPC